MTLCLRPEERTLCCSSSIAGVISWTFPISSPGYMQALPALPCTLHSLSSDQTLKSWVWGQHALVQQQDLMPLLAGYRILIVEITRASQISLPQRQLLSAVFAKQPVSDTTQPRLRQSFFSHSSNLQLVPYNFFLQGFLAKEMKQITSDLLLQLTSFSHSSHLHPQAVGLCPSSP